MSSRPPRAPCHSTPCRLAPLLTARLPPPVTPPAPSEASGTMPPASGGGMLPLMDSVLPPPVAGCSMACASGVTTTGRWQRWLIKAPMSASETLPGRLMATAQGGNCSAVLPCPPSGTGFIHWEERSRTTPPCCRVAMCRLVCPSVCCICRSVWSTFVRVLHPASSRHRAAAVPVRERCLFM
ncbi:hypothetical protein D3C80_1364750 [compost metagenome]